jgi:hypothetical protein
MVAEPTNRPEPRYGSATIPKLLPVSGTLHRRQESGGSGHDWRADDHASWSARQKGKVPQGLSARGWFFGASGNIA